MKRRCPGMDPAFFKPEDIGSQKCLKCGSDIEFWKDDVFLECPRCGARNTNVRLGNTCLAWCREASPLGTGAECIGRGNRAVPLRTNGSLTTQNRKGWKVGQTELQI